MTPDQADQIVALLATTFRPKDWTADAHNVYVQLILDLPFDRALAAAERYARTERFMPFPADIRRGARPADTTWAEEWRIVLDAVHRGRPPEFSDPRTQATVDALGWDEIRLSRVGDNTFRAHFRDVWTAFEGREQREREALAGGGYRQLGEGDE